MTNVHVSHPPVIAAPARHDFWFTTHVVNPCLRLVLRSPLGRVAGRSLASVAYRGRRTDAWHRLVAQYVREGSTVWIVPASPERKTWWRNFLVPGLIELRLAGHRCVGRAVVVDGRRDPELAAEGLEHYLRRFPTARTALGGLGERDDVLASHTLLIRVELLA